MDYTIDDCAKRRLTERADIVSAINILRSHGVRDDDLIVEMAKIFYIDLDEFNDIVNFHDFDEVMDLETIDGRVLQAA